jgi:hypothetical protein
LVLGTERGDGTEVLRRHGFRWSRNIGAWYLPHSRDRRPRRAAIDQVAAELRQGGHVVDIELVDTARTTAEVEVDRAARLSDRAGRLDARAGRLDAAAGTLHDEARAMADAIPFGQPILVGHHSERRDRSYRARMAGKTDRAVATSRQAEELARAAGASRATERHRLSAGAVRRRIDRLEAEERALGRRVSALPGSAYLGDYQPEFDRIAGDLSYWRAHLATLAAAGVKLWSAADFRPGDRVNDSATVVRVNAKTLTVRHDAFAHAAFTNPLPYDKVRSMARPAEHQGEPDA